MLIGTAAQIPITEIKEKSIIKGVVSCKTAYQSTGRIT
jgi:hypothetical protein